MAHLADRCFRLTSLALIFMLAACSTAEKDVASRRSSESQAALSAEIPGIVPSPAYGFHQLRLGSDVSAASFGGLTGADKGQLVIWTVNGKNVHTGASLEPSYTSPGDRVVAIIKAADASGTWQELSRHETIVQDSAPRIEEVHLQRDSSDPYLIQAILRAEDPDGEKIKLRYRWFVDGVLQEGQESAQLQLDSSRQGASVVVEAVALDGDLRSEARRSPETRIAGPTISLEVSESAQLRELEGGGHEYALSIEHTPGTRLEMLGAPASVSYKRGVLSWRPAEGETQLRMRVRIEGSDGSTVEREISLQL